MSTIAIIGTGIVGAWTAIECLDLGHEVVLIEPGPPGGRQATSFGNGGWIMETSLLPVATPGLWKTIPQLLLDPGAALTVRWRDLPRLSPWLIRFVASGATKERVAVIAAARHALLNQAGARYEAMAERVGMTGQLLSAGQLFVYPGLREHAAEALSWETRKQYGHSAELHQGALLRALEPGLNPAYDVGAFVRSGHHLADPGRFVQGMVAYAQRRGANLIAAAATGWRFDGDRLRAVETSMGDIDVGTAILTTGIASRGLAEAAGDHIPLESERGYRVLLRDPEYRPHHPVMPSDGKMAITMTPEGLRVAGQVELARIAAAPDWRRIDVLLDNLHRLYPEIPRRPDPARLDRWMGHRPSTPDSLPVIDRSARSPDVLYAFGHGHSGITLSPGTAHAVARLASRLPADINLTAYRASRF